MLDRGLKDTKVQRKVKLALWNPSMTPVCVPVKPLSEKYKIVPIGGPHYDGVVQVRTVQMKK